MEGEQIMEYVQETPIIPKRIIHYSIPKQMITKPAPHVEMTLVANTFRDMDLPQHPVIHDCWQNKEYSTQRYSGNVAQQRLSFEEHPNEECQNSVGLIKRVSTFFKKRPLSRKNSIKSTGDVKSEARNRGGGLLGEVDNLNEQNVRENLTSEHEKNPEGDSKRYGLFSFEETPPIQVLEQGNTNSELSSFKNTSLAANKRSSDSFVSLKPGEDEHSPLEISTCGNLTEREDLLITEIIRLENILNKHRKAEAKNNINKLEKKLSETDGFTSVNTSVPVTPIMPVLNTRTSYPNIDFHGTKVSDVLDAFEFEKHDDPLRDKWNTLQFLEKSFESKFESASELIQGGELAAIKERNFQLAKLNNLCFRVRESIKRRQDLEKKLRTLSQDTDNELLFLMLENERRKKSSVIIEFLSEIIREKSKRLTAEEQGFVNQNEVKPLILDLSARINRLNSILETKNTCIRRLSNQ
ncbi:BMC_2a_G0036800.mRNA.1.CDS.1 [Saccharomyces cerevisiae]|nr:BMB_G0036790.mRNA.1.CDS.1 [Saccharomyces cerevisiae]CAI4533229.1 BMC_2a_G0036800.mRNA.1.CDS.1 [Saccharomyces cerevisiae]CAI7160878.1 BMC_2a_G0036800.mRNA.1.CDS.1 [Saccharomyces cerevisiae]CAI7163787.1 BMB_G0036790.mRNA.1.CDS.1 [Saccharomyces cerevisiae]